MTPEKLKQLTAVLPDCEKARCFTEDEQLAFTSARGALKVLFSERESMRWVAPVLVTQLQRENLLRRLVDAFGDSL